MGTTTSGWRYGLALAGCLAACGGTISHGSSDGGGRGGVAANDEPDEPAVPLGGKSAMPGAAGKPGRAGSTGAGGRPAGTAGAASAGTNGGPCVGGKIMNDGACVCPAYAPDYCARAGKCVNTSKDPEHCGDCDTQCGRLNACSAGACSPDPANIAGFVGCGTIELQVANGTLYALLSKSGELVSIPLPADGTVAIAASDLVGGTAFAIAAGYAYVARATVVLRVNLATGEQTPLVAETSTIFDVAVANGKIYYATAKYIKEADAFASGLGSVVATAVDEGEPQGVAVSGTKVLYASNASFNVEVDAIVGDAHTKIGASQGSLVFGHRSVQADATHAYWANGSLQTARITADPQPVDPVAVPIDGSPVLAFAVDAKARMAYLATEDGSFEKSTFDAGIAGEEATWVLRGLNGGAGDKTTSVVLDDTKAYIATGCNILEASR